MEEKLNHSDFNSLKEKLKHYFKDDRENQIFNNAFFNTWDTTAKFEDDGSVFVITGDIPAMWLRDSSCQVLQYFYFIDDPSVKRFIRGVIKKQFEQINIDPYANAFMHDENCISEWHGRVRTDILKPIIWERKYELDSLCFPLFLASKYYDATEDATIFDSTFYQALDRILDLVHKEQHHHELSPYYFHFFERDEPVGLSTNPEEEKGLVWSGFRPSDDTCRYHYHIPDNMFLVTVFSKIAPILRKLNQAEKAEELEQKVNELVPLIEKYGTIDLPSFGKVYVSETNCLGEYHIDDDANIPSLLSLPFLEYPFLDETIYQNTRRYILSHHNKYYYEGRFLKGIGSPHTPKDRVWPLAVAMQGITSHDPEEIKECYDILIRSTVEDMRMHESVNVDDPHIYSRPWFAWANSTFAYFVLKNEKILKGK